MRNKTILNLVPFSDITILVRFTPCCSNCSLASLHQFYQFMLNPSKYNNKTLQIQVFLVLTGNISKNDPTQNFFLISINSIKLIFNICGQLTGVFWISKNKIFLQLFTNWQTQWFGTIFTVLYCTLLVL